MSGYGRGARTLSIGLAATGVFTFAYFSVASHVLTEVEAKRLNLLWSVMFVILSVIYRPVEQLLSRTIAERRALGQEVGDLRAPLLIQGAFALAFLVFALVFRGPLVDDVFDGSQALWWVLTVGTLAYAASYFARGFLAGSGMFGLYGGLVLLESVSRFLFPVGVALGIATGQTAVALGILAAPFVSLVVVPWAFARRSREREPPPDDDAVAAARDARQPAAFAVAVAGIMLAEQTLLNAGVLTTDAVSPDPALAGIVFNVLLIVRAPLQLFQAVQGSLLPHLTSAETTGDRDAFRRAVRTTVLVLGAFGAVTALGLLLVGPWAMSLLFGQDFDYGRVGLALIGLGMGLHLVAGTFNQALLARRQAAAAVVAWAVCALAFVAWTLVPVVDDVLLRVQIGYPVATGVLAVALGALLLRRGAPRRQMSE